MARARNFNSYFIYTSEQDFVEKYNKYIDVKWLVGQKETTTAGNNHFQFVFGTHNAKTRAAVIKTFNDPNIQITNDTEKMYKYCTDETKRLEGTEIYCVGDMPRTISKNRGDGIKHALQLSTYEEAMKYMEESDIEYFVQHRGNLSKYFSTKFDQGDVILYSLDMFQYKPVQFTGNKALLFIGPTGIGKTQFALAHFKSPVKITNNEDYSRISSATDGIILDDLNFSSWSPMTMLHLVDVESPYTINVKYGSARIPAFMKRIFIVNDEELFWPTNIHPETRKAIERRVVKHHFYNALFSKDADGSKKRKIDDLLCNEILTTDELQEQPLQEIQVMSPGFYTEMVQRALMNPSGDVMIQNGQADDDYFRFINSE